MIEAALRRGILAAAGSPGLQRFVSRHGMQLGAARFVGGETMDDAVPVHRRLNERGLPWRIYHGDIPQSLVLTHQRTVQNARRYEFMDVFFSDARGQEEQFPAFSFIEPCYYWPGQNDDHPPHTTLRAQALLGSVYNALRQNDRLWNSTLLVALYDEHGGFYDHVPPPAAVPP